MVSIIPSTGSESLNYFERDAKALAEAARNDPEVVLRIITLVLLSIRQPWHKMPEQFSDVLLHGDDSKWLFGFKRDGYRIASEHKKYFQEQAIVYRGDLTDLIHKLMRIPGLGLAKASFAAQMLVNDGACLDSHNLNRMGLTPNFTRIDKNADPSIVHRRICEYNTAWKPHGDSAYWWNSWCENLVGRNFVSADEVSAVHLLPLH